ncbi:MAG: hypothetical protein AAF705_18200, partial [Bacteroidota bacterium]
DKYLTILSIDGQYPYGGQYVLPEVEIKAIEIEIDGRSIHIPKAAYANLFHPEACVDNYFVRPISAYESLNREYLYLYIYGDQAAGSYFAKLIFDHTSYRTRIISDYGSLSMHGSFRGDFIGF